MSWHFLQGQEVASWAPSSSAGAPPALLRLIPTADGSCSSGRRTGTSTDSQSGMTSRRSTGTRGAVQLTLFRRASLARRSARGLRVKLADCPADVQASSMRCYASLEKYGLRLSSPKTARDYEPMALAPSSARLPNWGMTAHGACWALGTRVRRTSGTAFGCLLPTPAARSYGSNGNAPGEKGERRMSLPQLARHGLLPGVMRVVRRGVMAAPPTWRSAHAPAGRTLTLSTAQQIARLKPSTGGAINPAWIAWLMGWPPGWTDLEPLGTDRFQRWRRSHFGPWPLR